MVMGMMTMVEGSRNPGLTLALGAKRRLGVVVGAELSDSSFRTVLPAQPVHSLCFSLLLQVHISVLACLHSLSMFPFTYRIPSHLLPFSASPTATNTLVRGPTSHPIFKVWWSTARPSTQPC